MQKRLSSRIILVGLLVWLVTPARVALSVQTLEPIVYTIKFPAPDTHIADVEVKVPTGKRAVSDMMMAVWSPGFYRVENYANRVQDLSARTPDGTPRQVQQPEKNRWRIQTGGWQTVIVSYRLLCSGRSVTTNWVGNDLAVLNGPATFITLVEKTRRRHDVRLELPPVWQRSMTSLDAEPDGVPNHYRAPDYDTLADSPIVAGNMIVNEFEVDGSKHYVVDAGEVGQRDSKRAAQDLEKIVRETRRFWGFLPFQKYVFLTVFRQGGGGLEQASLDVWSSGTSGAGRDTATKVSYYVKGPVVGFLLDAKIQRVTGGKKSLDDVMKLAYKRYSGERGFTPEQFRQTAEEVAGVDLKEWFRKALASTEELDYVEALDWFGLRFAAPNVQSPASAWKLEIRDDATEAQKSHFRGLVGQGGKQ